MTKNKEDSKPIPAGIFSDWLNKIQDAQKNSSGTVVPCGECNACCRSSYFIHIRPDEYMTLASIPKALLFPAPGLPKGNMVMGYNELGHCPMLIDGKCSIYEQRPRTCRSYDCRVFSACSMAAGGEKKELINQQLKRWKFSFPDTTSRRQKFALQSATRFLLQHSALFPADFLPSNPTQMAIMAIKIYALFLQYTDPSGTAIEVPDTLAMAHSIVKDFQKFDSDSS